MALPPGTSNEAFFREVDDAVREEAMLDIWRRYGRLIVVAILLGLALFAAWLGWTRYQEHRAQQASEQLQTLIQGAASSRTLDPRALKAVRESGLPVYASNARLLEAAIAADKKDLKTAAARYGAIAADAKAPQPYRDLALVRQTALQFDTLPPQQVVDRLRPLAMPGNPWFGSAGEMTAIAYLKLKKPALAGPLFAAIARDKAVPASIRTRAVQMAGLLGVDAVDEGKAGSGDGSANGG